MIVVEFLTSRDLELPISHCQCVFSRQLSDMRLDFATIGTVGAIATACKEGTRRW